MATNPLREGLVEDRLPEPCAIVIFGASGDLTKRKLVPALYSLAKERLLPPSFAIVGVARRDIGDDAFRAQMREGCDRFARARPVDPSLWETFAQGLSWHTGPFEDPATYASLKRHLDAIDRERGLPGNRLFYVSTPPSSFEPILENLGAAGLIQPLGPDGRRLPGTPWTRIIVEKPFGTDLETARALNRTALSVADERQIYRIDHYLGKETVQNLMAFRFANEIFEPIWNNRHVDHVQITGAEAIGVEGRGNYFEEAGILRDMVQNHLFQILTLTTMEPPAAFNADDLRDEKVKVLKSLRPVDDFARDVVRGQYRAGSIGGRAIGGYEDEPGVRPGSTTETYVALRFFVDNWRWAGVPFYLRAGKAMPKKVTEVALVFKQPPVRLFPSLSDPNVLVIRIQPDEGISIRFGSKIPGPTMDVHPVNMEFRYGTSFGTEPPEAYERLLLDAMLGDASLFTRGDEVEASWRWIGRIHRAWAEDEARYSSELRAAEAALRAPHDGIRVETPGRQKRSSPEEGRTAPVSDALDTGRGAVVPGLAIPTYAAGDWGPAEADALLARDGRAWRNP